LIENKEVSWLPSYGPEMRGGTANCGVCISDEPIGSPLVLEPDVLVVMNGPSYDKFVRTVAPGGKVFLDSSLVECAAGGRSDIQFYGIPAARISRDEKLEGIANMIMLGNMLAKTEIVSFESVEKAIRKIVPPSREHLISENLRAVELGRKQ